MELPGDKITIMKRGNVVHMEDGGSRRTHHDQIGTAGTVAKGKAYVEAMEAWPADCRWKLNSPPSQKEPQPGKGVVWEYMYPEGDGRGSTGLQVHWKRPASRP